MKIPSRPPRVSIPDPALRGDYCRFTKPAKKLRISKAEREILLRIFRDSGAAAIGIDDETCGDDDFCFFHTDPKTRLRQFPLTLKDINDPENRGYPMEWRLGTPYAKKVVLEKKFETKLMPRFGRFWKAQSAWQGALLAPEEVRGGWQPRQEIYFGDDIYEAGQIIQIHHGVLTRFVSDGVVCHGLLVKQASADGR